MAPSGANAATIADFIFVIDRSISMINDLPLIASQLDAFPDVLGQFGIEGRYAVVAFGTNPQSGQPAPRLVTDGYVDDGVSLAAAVGGLSNEIVGPVESGTEAIIDALSLQRWPQLQFRPDAIRNLILITDEDDDRPVSVMQSQGGGREPPIRWPPDPTGNDADFQDRIDQAADLLIANQVLLNMVINPQQAPSKFQYGDPAATVLDGDGRLNVLDTLAALGPNLLGLQGQLLSAGIVARAFPMSASRENPTTFWQGFFEAKATEVIPEPGTFGLMLTALLGLAILRLRS
jgi:hypothetical protein